MIELKNITKKYNNGKEDLIAIDDVSLKIENKDIFGIIGFSGAGKSTLLRCINLLEKPDVGEVLFKKQNLLELNKKELRETRKKIGMIFQNYNLFNMRNVYENIEFPLRYSSLSEVERKNKINRLLKLVKLENKRYFYPEELSGGEKQRVAIARALANDPDVLLCDEATSALDPKTTNDILELLDEINKKLNITIVMVTHEMNVVKKICNKVAIMKDGKIIESGSTINVFTNPKTQSSKDILLNEYSYSNIDNIINRFNFNHHNKLIKLIYLGDNTKKAIISKVSKEYEIDINILFGNIDIIENKIVGSLMINLEGNEKQIEKGIRYFKENNFIVEVINNE